MSYAQAASEFKYYDEVMKWLQLRQIIEALTCPLNRHCARVEHKCDDWELFKNYHWLIERFIYKGGAPEFAKLRSEYLKALENEPEYQI